MVHRGRFQPAPILNRRRKALGLEWFARAGPRHARIIRLRVLRPPPPRGRNPASFPAFNAKVTFHQNALVAPTYGGSVPACPQGIGLQTPPTPMGLPVQTRGFERHTARDQVDAEHPCERSPDPGSGRTPTPGRTLIQPIPAVLTDRFPTLHPRCLLAMTPGPSHPRSISSP